MRTRIGKAEAITATAHVIARIVYTLIKTGAAYNPDGQKSERGLQAWRQVQREEDGLAIGSSGKRLNPSP